MTTTTSPQRRRPAIAALIAGAALAVVGTLLPVVSASDPASAAGAGAFEKIGEFRPFGVENDFPQAASSAVDAARRRWFLIGANGSADGFDGRQHVYVFDLDTMKQIGDSLELGSVPENMPVYGIDAATGHLIVASGSGAQTELLVVDVTADGPRVLERWPFGSSIDSGVPGLSLFVAGIDVHHGKVYVGADSANLSTAAARVRLLQVDAARLAGGQEPLDWQYDVENCFALARFKAQAAVGRSRFGPRILLPCRPAGSVQVQSIAQGVGVVDLVGGSPTTFTDALYPVGGELAAAQTFFDRATDRLVMRRTQPAQLFVFDGRHRTYLRPIAFGRGNLYQAGINPATGRLYGHGDETRSGKTREFVYVPELRPTPAPNGLDVSFKGPSPDTNFAASGTLAIDPSTGRVIIADVDADRGPEQNGRPTYIRKGAFFHVYRDTRPALAEREAPDPDANLISPAGEAQGYGARFSWVGGTRGTWTNSGQSYQFEGELAGGSRHLTFARTLDLRVSASEAKGRAIELQPEGATEAETTRAGQSWPYDEAECVDFGAAPTEETAPRNGAVVTCDGAAREATSRATYEPGADDPFAVAVEEATTEAATKVDPERGIVTTVTSEASFEIPGVLQIGRVSARAETVAAGTAGSAVSNYERSFSDVSVFGTSLCMSSCDPDRMAEQINDAFAEQNSQTGTIVQVSVPEPDPERRASPGGAEAVVQRDFWEHEQDVALHEMSEDRYELPAIEIAVYRDRGSPEHYVYWLAGVQAVSRFPVGFTFDRPADETFSPGFSASGPVALPPAPLPPASVGDLSGGTFESVGGATLVRDEAPQPSAAPPGDSGLLPRLRDLARDLAWALRWPFSSPALMALWAFLGIPVFLASRRRLLLRRHAQLGGLT